MFFKRKLEDYFTSKNWKILSINRKEKITFSLFDKIKKNIPNNCSKLIIKNFNSPDINGFFSYDDKIIKINADLLTSNRDDNCYVLYNTLYHELYHSHQNKLIETNSFFKLNKIIQFNDVFYIQSKKAYLYINDYNNLYIRSKEIALCFYVLCSLEREAFNYAYENVLKITEKYDDIVQIKLQNFRELYNISLSDKEIFTLIDTCYLNIYDHIKPANDLEATIMYDICILALYQGKSLNEKEVSKYLNKETKQEILETQGYNIYNPNFIPNNSFSKKYDITILSMNEINDIINNMNKAQIKNNPTFLYKAQKLLQDQKTAKKNCNNNIIDINITHNDDCNYELE